MYKMHHVNNLSYCTKNESQVENKFEQNSVKHIIDNANSAHRPQFAKWPRQKSKMSKNSLSTKTACENARSPFHFNSDIGDNETLRNFENENFGKGNIGDIIDYGRSPRMVSKYRDKSNKYSFRKIKFSGRFFNRVRDKLSNSRVETHRSHNILTTAVRKRKLMANRIKSTATTNIFKAQNNPIDVEPNKEPTDEITRKVIKHVNSTKNKFLRSKRRRNSRILRNSFILRRHNYKSIKYKDKEIEDMSEQKVHYRVKKDLHVESNYSLDIIISENNLSGIIAYQTSQIKEDSIVMSALQSHLTVKETKEGIQWYTEKSEVFEPKQLPYELARSKMNNNKMIGNVHRNAKYRKANSGTGHVLSSGSYPKITLKEKKVRFDRNIVAQNKNAHRHAATSFKSAFIRLLKFYKKRSTRKRTKIKTEAKSWLDSKTKNTATISKKLRNQKAKLLLEQQKINDNSTISIDTSHHKRLRPKHQKLGKDIIMSRYTVSTSSKCKVRANCTKSKFDIFMCDDNRVNQPLRALNDIRIEEDNILKDLNVNFDGTICKDCEILRKITSKYSNINVSKSKRNTTTVKQPIKTNDNVITRYFGTTCDRDLVQLYPGKFKDDHIPYKQNLYVLNVRVSSTGVKKHEYKESDNVKKSKLKTSHLNCKCDSGKIISKNSPCTCPTVESFHAPSVHRPPKVPNLPTVHDPIRVGSNISFKFELYNQGNLTDNIWRKPRCGLTNNHERSNFAQRPTKPTSKKMSWNANTQIKIGIPNISNMVSKVKKSIGNVENNNKNRAIKQTHLKGSDAKTLTANQPQSLGVLHESRKVNTEPYKVATRVCDAPEYETTLLNGSKKKESRPYVKHRRTSHWSIKKQNHGKKIIDKNAPSEYTIGSTDLKKEAIHVGSNLSFHIDLYKQGNILSNVSQKLSCYIPDKHQTNPTSLPTVGKGRCNSLSWNAKAEIKVGIPTLQGIKSKLKDHLPKKRVVVKPSKKSQSVAANEPYGDVVLHKSTKVNTENTGYDMADIANQHDVALVKPSITDAKPKPALRFGSNISFKVEFYCGEHPDSQISGIETERRRSNYEARDPHRGVSKIIRRIRRKSRKSVRGHTMTRSYYNKPHQYFENDLGDATIAQPLKVRKNKNNAIEGEENISTNAKAPSPLSQKHKTILNDNLGLLKNCRCITKTAKKSEYKLVKSVAKEEISAKKIPRIHKNKSGYQTHAKKELEVIMPYSKSKLKKNANNNVLAKIGKEQHPKKENIKTIMSKVQSKENVSQKDNQLKNTPFLNINIDILKKCRCLMKRSRNKGNEDLPKSAKSKEIKLSQTDIHKLVIGNKNSQKKYSVKMKPHSKRKKNTNDKLQTNVSLKPNPETNDHNDTKTKIQSKENESKKDNRQEKTSFLNINKHILTKCRCLMKTSLNKTGKKLSKSKFSKEIEESGIRTDKLKSGDDSSPKYDVEEIKPYSKSKKDKTQPRDFQKQHPLKEIVNEARSKIQTKDDSRKEHRQKHRPFLNINIDILKKCRCLLKSSLGKREKKVSKTETNKKNKTNYLKNNDLVKPVATGEKKKSRLKKDESNLVKPVATGEKKKCRLKKDERNLVKYVANEEIKSTHLKKNEHDLAKPVATGEKKKTHLKKNERDLVKSDTNEEMKSNPLPNNEHELVKSVANDENIRKQSSREHRSKDETGKEANSKRKNNIKDEPLATSFEKQHPETERLKEDVREHQFKVGNLKKYTNLKSWGKDVATSNDLKNTPELNKCIINNKIVCSACKRNELASKGKSSTDTNSKLVTMIDKLKEKVKAKVCEKLQSTTEITEDGDHEKLQKLGVPPCPCDDENEDTNTSYSCPVCIALKKTPIELCKDMFTKKAVNLKKNTKAAICKWFSDEEIKEEKAQQIHYDPLFDIVLQNEHNMKVSNKSDLMDYAANTSGDAAYGKERPHFDILIEKGNVEIMNKADIWKHLNTESVGENKGIDKGEKKKEAKSKKGVSLSINGKECKCCPQNRRLKKEEKIDLILSPEYIKPKPCICGSDTCKIRKEHLDMKRVMTQEKIRKKRPCTCGSYVCKEEALFDLKNQKKKLEEEKLRSKMKALAEKRKKTPKKPKKAVQKPKKKPKVVPKIKKKSITAEEKELETKREKKILEARKKKQRKIDNYKRKQKIQTNKIKAKESAKNQKRYRREDIKILKSREKQDKEIAKLIRKHKHSDALLCTDSMLDMCRLAGNTCSTLTRGTLRAIENPIRAKANIKKFARHPDDFARALKQSASDLGVVPTVSRIRKRISKMSCFHKAVRKLESKQMTNYMLHFADKNPKKRLKKTRPVKRVREPLDFQCSLYMSSLRKRPHWVVYFALPWFYPHWLNFIRILKQAKDIVTMLFALVVWTPCIICVEGCRAVLCCFLCTD